MSEIKNLWPADLLKVDGITLPITILQEQARFLNEMTKNIVVASVDTKSIAISIERSNQTKPAIMHTLKILAPAIGNYDFELLRLIQEGIVPYPLRIHVPLIEQSFEINSSEELESKLTDIFMSKIIISTLQSLIIQSTQ